MKSSNKNSIFALILGFVLIMSNEAAFAGNGEGIEKPLVAGISKESEIEFSSYIEQTVPVFTKEGNWSIIEKVVTLYNQSPSEIRLLNQQEIHSFNAAVAELGSKLENVNSKEADQWKSNLYKTASSVRFVKNFDLNSLASNDQVTGIEIPRVFVTL